VPVRPLKSPDVYDEVLPDGGLVLFHSQRALILTLNPTAALIWEYCDGAHDVGAIAAQLIDLFPTATDTERDTRSVLATLCEAGLIADAAPES
jgi:coenzyme PQQ synthesis protein D (PqqD)